MPLPRVGTTAGGQGAGPVGQATAAVPLPGAGTTAGGQGADPVGQVTAVVQLFLGTLVDG